MANHDPKNYLNKLTEELANAGTPVVIGQMFGKPCIQREGKAMVAMFHGDAVFKLDNTAPALSLQGAHQWDPSGKGRPMKAWVVVPAKHRRRWLGLARQALSV